MTERTLTVQVLFRSHVSNGVWVKREHFCWPYVRHSVLSVNFVVIRFRDCVGFAWDFVWWFL